MSCEVCKKYFELIYKQYQEEDSIRGEYLDLESNCKFCPECGKDLKDNNGWISVSERLPEENQKVLVTSGGEIGIATYEWFEEEAHASLEFLGEFLGRGAIFSDITHWQLLPEPPEVE